MVNRVAVFDIGKTYKKLLLFDEEQKIVFLEETTLPEAQDEEGHACEDLKALTRWLLQTWQDLEANLDFNVTALNFTTYGASLVHLDLEGQPLTPIYNYLKPFPEDQENHFYRSHGDKYDLATATASPALGMLNAGLQLFGIKHRRPKVFRQLAYTLHFPQYLSFLFTGQLVSEFTSLGCHTALWDFQKKDYHDWVRQEGLDDLFPALRSHQRPFSTRFRNQYIPAGLGLHDSSAALIPYLQQYQEPFLLLSTGTWGITLNPFAQQALTVADLQRDCLLYLTHDGKPVKASRYFMSNGHEEQVSRLAQYFGKKVNHYKKVTFDATLADQLILAEEGVRPGLSCKIGKGRPQHLDMTQFDSYEAGYHQLLRQMVRRQAKFIRLAAEGQPGRFKTLLVDGGFSRNEVFLALLQQELPGLEVRVGQTAEGTALGAALLMPGWHK